MTFSYADYHTSIREFAEEVPQLLLRHPATAHLALRISELDLPSVLVSRFTVAVIGQMRAGKSTLVNALIGQRLAPVGITETTATINWFRHAGASQQGTFRVHWLDGSMEDRPLAEAGAWIGQAENAKRTRALDFFAASEFLATANIVDTPGTRSTLEAHQTTTTDFLAERLEEETLRHGGRADAVVYVVNPIAKADDDELLRWFSERTRLPGASAMNSIAVVQKWEQIRPNPLAKIEDLCDDMRAQLEGKVCEVLPVSGILALAAVEAPLAVWNQIGELAVGASTEVFEDLTLSPTYFGDDLPGAPLDRAIRESLLAQLPWPVLSFALWLARRDRPTDGGALRAALLAVSNLDRLKELLCRRFFDLAGLIQAGTALRKAWEPCQVGRLTFREEIKSLRGAQANGRQALDKLAQSPCASELALVQAHVQATASRLDRELSGLVDAYERFDRLFHREERNFRLLDADIAQLALLETGVDLGPDELRELQALFGQQGPEVTQRLRCADDSESADLLDLALERHGYWKTRAVRGHGRERVLFDHAVERLETIVDQLDSLS